MDWVKVKCTVDRDTDLVEGHVMFDRIDSSHVIVEPTDVEKARRILSNVAETLNAAKKEKKVPEGPITVSPEERVKIPTVEGISETFEFIRDMKGLFFEVSAPHVESMEKCEIDIDKIKLPENKCAIYVMAYPKVKGVEFKTIRIPQITIFKTTIPLVGGCCDAWYCNEDSRELLIKDGWSLFEDNNRTMIACWKGRSIFFLPDISHEKPNVDLFDDKINLIKVVILTWVKSCLPSDPTKLEIKINDVKSRIFFDGEVPKTVLTSLKKRYCEDEENTKKLLKDTQVSVERMSKELTSSYVYMVSLEQRLKLLKTVTIDIEEKFLSELDKLKVHPRVSNVKFDKSGEMLRIVTTPIAVDGVWVGKYTIAVPLSNNRETQIELRNLFPQPKSKRHHPHIETSGNTCYGNIKNIVIEMGARMQLFELVDLMVSFLESVNKGDPWGKEIEQWHTKEAREFYEGLFGKVAKKVKPVLIKPKPEGEEVNVQEGQ